MIEIDAMFPVMVTENLDAVKRFYETVFGFTAVFYDADFYLHLISPNNSIQLAFLLPNLTNQPEFLHPIMSSEGFVISLEVKDAALAYSEAQKMNLNFIMGLKQEEWGQLHFIIQDPAGYSVDIVQHLEQAGD
ncbi:MAG: VOC family protein [Oleispira sp.]